MVPQSPIGTRSGSRSCSASSTRLRCGGIALPMIAAILTSLTDADVDRCRATERGIYVGAHGRPVQQFTRLAHLFERHLIGLPMRKTHTGPLGPERAANGRRADRWPRIPYFAH